MIGVYLFVAIALAVFGTVGFLCVLFETVEYMKTKEDAKAALANYGCGLLACALWPLVVVGIVGFLLFHLFRPVFHLIRLLRK